MKFQKGNNYGKGRKPGSKNKVAHEVKQRLSDLSLQALNKIDIETMKDDQLLKFLSYSLNYIMPKLRQIDQDTTIHQNSEHLEILEGLNEEQLQENFLKIKSRVL